MLDELKAEPRRETLAVADGAGRECASATLKNAQDQLAKQEQSYAIDAEVGQPRRARQRQECRKDRGHQPRGRSQAVQPHQGRRLGLRHPQPGKAVQRALPRPMRPRRRCSPSTPSGRLPTAWCARFRPPSAATSRRRAPTTPTRRGMDPLIVMGTPDDHLQVRVYVDEILIPPGRSREDERRDVHPRHRRPCAADVRPHAAVRVARRSSSPNRTPGAGRPARAAGHLPLRAAQGVIVYPGQLVDVYVGAK